MSEPIKVVSTEKFVKTFRSEAERERDIEEVVKQIELFPNVRVKSIDRHTGDSLGYKVTLTLEVTEYKYADLVVAHDDEVVFQA